MSRDSLWWRLVRRPLLPSFFTAFTNSAGGRLNFHERTVGLKPLASLWWRLVRHHLFPSSFTAFPNSAGGRLGLGERIVDFLLLRYARLQPARQQLAYLQSPPLRTSPLKSALFSPLLSLA